jgi:hypothetical protein
MPRTVSKKMGIKERTRAILVNAPEAAWGAIDPPSLDVASELAGEFDYIHLFARTRAELDDVTAQFSKIASRRVTLLPRR